MHEALARARHGGADAEVSEVVREPGVGRELRADVEVGVDVETERPHLHAGPEGRLRGAYVEPPLAALHVHTHLPEVVADAVMATAAAGHAVLEVGAQVAAELAGAAGAAAGGVGHGDVGAEGRIARGDAAGLRVGHREEGARAVDADVVQSAGAVELRREEEVRVEDAARGQHPDPGHEAEVDGAGVGRGHRPVAHARDGLPEGEGRAPVHIGEVDLRGLVRGVGGGHVPGDAPADGREPERRGDDDDGGLPEEPHHVYAPVAHPAHGAEGAGGLDAHPERVHHCPEAPREAAPVVDAVDGLPGLGPGEPPFDGQSGDAHVDDDAPHVVVDVVEAPRREVGLAPHHHPGPHAEAAAPGHEPDAALDPETEAVGLVGVRDEGNLLDRHLEGPEAPLEPELGGDAPAGAEPEVGRPRGQHHVVGADALEAEGLGALPEGHPPVERQLPEPAPEHAACTVPAERDGGGGV